MSKQRSNFDLILFNHNGMIAFERISPLQAHQLYDTGEFVFNKVVFNTLKPFSDWLALVGDSARVVGVQLTTIVQPELITRPFFNARNLSKHNEDLLLVFGETKTVRTEGWPLATVYSLANQNDQTLLFIPEFYAAKQTIPVAEVFLR